MRHSRVCPKCQSQKIWVIEAFGVKDGSVTYGGKLALRIVARDPNKKKGWLGVEDSYDAGYTDAWICAHCGFTELWTRDLKGLVHNPEGGVHLLDGEADP